MFSRHYQIVDTLHENTSTVVHRATRSIDGKSVIIKMLKPGEINEHRVSQFMNEQQILSQLKSSKIVKLIEIIATPSEYLHVFEDIGGSSLYDILLKHRFSISEALNIAIKIAETLKIIHQHHIIHADINPKNIIYNLDTKSLQIIDFGYSVFDNHIKYNSDEDVGTSGNLMYMSPEQTGRTKQRIDLRSDLYSFGMSLYHLFSTRAPFEAKDRYELIHKQIALRPTPIESIVENFPLVLSSIINRLTSKKPEERYQSDDALIYDLKLALRTLTRSGQIPYFEIGTHDQPVLHFGSSLFGRQAQLKLLDNAIRNVSLGQTIRLVVSGVGGVGKTRFIEEALHQLSHKNVRILKGKFEQNRSSHPYLSFKQLFVQLKQMWALSSSRKSTIHLDNRSSQILSHYFPELRDLFSDKLMLHTVTSDDIRHQLPYALGALLKQIVTETSPLVIFIDDLHWADNASLDLIQKVILQSEIPNLHFIFSYRSNEIELNPMAAQIVKRVRENRSEEIYFFDLEPLEAKEMREMFHALLGSIHKDIDHLSDLIHKKTEGNFFYIKTFLENLMETRAITYKNGKWIFDLEDIASYSSMVNVSEIIHTKFSELNHTEQYYLYYLSLLGSRFETELTFRLMKAMKYPKSVMLHLESKGFVEIYNGYYQFSHDIIQNHILQSIPVDSLEEIHQTIGKFLENLYRKGVYTDIINIVSHLNNGFVKREWNKRSLKLNLIALSEMVMSGSYALALNQLRWLDTNGAFEKIYLLTHSDQFALKVIRIKIFYLNTHHQEAQSYLQILIHETRTTEEMSVCFTLFKDLCVTKGEGFEELVLFGNRLLNQFGVSASDNADAIAHTVIELKYNIRHHLDTHHADTIIELPNLRAKSKRQIIAILVEYWEAAYYLANIELMQWAYLSIIDISLRYGNTSGSAFGYVLYGAQMISEGRYKEGYRFGESALKLNHKFADLSMLPKIYNFVANFISPYTKPLVHNLSLYQKSLHQSKINGDIVFGTWANFLMHFSDYLSGRSLETLHENIQAESKFLLNSGDKKMIAIFEILQSTIRVWQDKDDQNPTHEQEAIALWEAEKFYPALAWYGIMKAQICWIEGEIDLGLEYLHRYVYTDANEVIMFPKLRLHPLRALLLLGKSTPLSADEALLLKNDLKQCEGYAISSPKEFKFWKLLIRAKSAKNSKNYWDVAKYYDAALNEARKMANPFAIAASAACTGRFWKAKMFEDLSQFYFNEALVGLNQWGAYGAAERMKNQLYVNRSQPVEELSYSSNSSLLRSEPSNYRSLLKSFYALSQSMEKKELLQTLMQIILENATASKGVLILKEENSFFTNAQINFKTGNIELYHTPLYETDFLPLHFITDAIDTKHKIFQNSPADSGKFQYDPYFIANKPASSIALPVLIEGEILGVLYLENQEIPTPLDSNSLQTLRLLLTQAIIIYKNTLLYETLKSNEEKLNKAQQISHVGSWQYDSVSNDIIWSAETYRIYEMEPFSIAIDNEWFFAHLHPDDTDLIHHAVEKAFKGERYYDVTHRIITAKGNIRIVHQRAEVFWEGERQKFSGTIQDITEIKRTEEIINRLSQVVNQIPLSTIITDPDGVIEYANTHASKLTGYFNTELIGQKMSLFNSGIHPQTFYTDLWNTIHTKRSFWRGTIINRMKNGEMRDCACTIFPIINDEDKIINFVTIQDDVTERNMKDRLFLMQTRQAQMGEMLSMIAHQWRQPLTIMSALMSRQKINIMLERSSIEDILKCFDDVEIQIQHLSQTITDFKDFFKPDKQMVQTKNSTIIKKTLELVEHTLMNKNIQIYIEYSNDQEYTTYENELIQVVLNLIKNAQDAFEERSIKNPIIKITTDQYDGYNLIQVDDNAGGIATEIIDTLFEPYISTKKENGTGLGLYMSKTIIEEHCHGTITAKNINNGVSFKLRFPLHYSL